MDLYNEFVGTARNKKPPVPPTVVCSVCGTVVKRKQIKSHMKHCRGKQK